MEQRTPGQMIHRSVTDLTRNMYFSDLSVTYSGLTRLLKLHDELWLIVLLKWFYTLVLLEVYVDEIDWFTINFSSLFYFSTSKIIQ